MKLWDKRNTIRGTFEWAIDWRDDWDKLAEPERTFVAELLKLDPETLAWDDYVTFMKASGYWNRYGMLASCDECGAKEIPTVEFCEGSDHDEPWAHLCADCLEKALKLLRGEKVVIDG